MKKAKDDYWAGQDWRPSAFKVPKPDNATSGNFGTVSSIDPVIIADPKGSSFNGPIKYFRAKPL